MSLHFIQNTLKYSQRFILIFLSVIALCFAGSGYAATTTVPCGGSDATSAIQSAVDSANAGEITSSLMA